MDEPVRTITKYCELKNYEAYDIYSEISSAINTERKEFNRLMHDAFCKKFDVVIVQKYDRFSRTIIDWVNNFETLESSDIELISVDDYVDTTTPQGKLTFHMMGAFSEYETSLIVNRTIIGIGHAKREGKVCHRPKKEY